MIQIVLRRARRMVGMRMVEPQQFLLQRAPLPLRRIVVRRPDQKPPPRPFFRRVRQRRHVLHDAVRADERAAALVRIRLDAMTPNGVRDAGMSLNDSDMNSGPLDPYAGTFQKRSDMYLSALSGKMVTITRIPARFAPLSARRPAPRRPKCPRAALLRAPGAAPCV